MKKAVWVMAICLTLAIGASMMIQIYLSHCSQAFLQQAELIEKAAQEDDNEALRQHAFALQREWEDAGVWVKTILDHEHVHEVSIQIEKLLSLNAEADKHEALIICAKLRFLFREMDHEDELRLENIF